MIVASFASHIHRLQQVCDAAVANGRKVVVTGRSMVQNTKVARELGYLHIDDDNIVDAFELGRPARPRRSSILCTGSQGEPLSALARMANGDHRTVTVEQGDTVIISASPVPGNEKAVCRVINRLAKAGANVVHKGTADVHVSGHAAAEDLKLMLNLTQPEYFMPIHGETRHLAAHATHRAGGGRARRLHLRPGQRRLPRDRRGRARVWPSGSRAASSTSTACRWATSARSCFATAST